MTRFGKIAAATLGLLIFAEVAGRIAWHHHLENLALQNAQSSCSTTDGPLYELDPQTGYSYVSGARLHLTLYDQKNKPLRTNNVVVNNLGHLSFQSDSFPKPQSEFRIAVIGDSFTATTPSDVTWPTLLEGILNQDGPLKKAIGKTAFKVLNFGLDGTGFVQWPSVYQHKVVAFRPDLVIVNFIANDIDRKFLYRNTVTIGRDDRAVITCTSLPAVLANPDCGSAYLYVVRPGAPDSADELTRFKSEMAQSLVARLPWYTLDPQLPGILLNGRFGVASRLRLGNGGTPLFDNSAEAMTASRTALETIASVQRFLLVLYHPMLQECLSGKAPPEVKTLMAEEKALAIQNMLDFLPLSSGQDEIRKWYNIPWDQHPSDYGAQVYAQAVEGRVSAWLSGALNVPARKPVPSGTR